MSSEHHAHDDSTTGRADVDPLVVELAEAKRIGRRLYNALPPSQARHLLGDVSRWPGLLEPPDTVVP